MFVGTWGLILMNKSTALSLKLVPDKEFIRLFDFFNTFLLKSEEILAKDDVLRGLNVIFEGLPAAVDTSISYNKKRGVCYE